MKKSGFVYFFRHTGTDYVKIGYTCDKSIDSRFAAFKTYSPHGASIDGIIVSENAFELEKKLHKELADHRMNGEFFLLTQTRTASLIAIYDTDIRSEARTTFERWLSIANNKDISLFASNGKMSNVYIKSEDIGKDDLYIIGVVNRFFIKKFFTASDVVMMIADTVEDPNMIPSPLSVGRTLKKAITQKSKKIDGVVRKMYYTPDEILLV